MERWSKPNWVGTRNYSENLLCHYLFSDGSAQYVFLDLVDEGSAVVNRSLSFCTTRNLHVCASANGLLLLSSVQDNQVSYNLFNLFSKRREVLPRPQITRRSIRTGLAFDGFRYQVVRVFSVDVEEECAPESSSAAVPPTGSDGFLEMEIFSSETNIWRRYRPLIRLPPDLPKLDMSPLFANGAIYWELGGYLLVYHANHGLCRVIELPNYPQRWSWNSLTFGQCLFESEGRLHYCYSDSEGIHIWVLIKEQDHDFYSNYVWNLVHTARHQNLISQNSDVFLRIRQRNNLFSHWEPYFLSPFAYIGNSQTMYLRLPGSIVTYDLRTQSLREICTYEFPNMNFYCCLLFPVVYGLQGDSRDRQPQEGIREVIPLPMRMN
ncbi:hypothetical protein Pint_02467 [Pistacia integerrima]|uniref:Uncharacterized protein n=1 Tax=Pistacia integerrima TaxID=434235 RepID=A0ACC0ZP14_9ROSI|nr:hypothetical protein Pint_02467 [Pistacia integerrima]